MERNLVKTEFDFGWKRRKSIPPYFVLALQYQKGDVLDVGCGTCQLYAFLRTNGWQGKYCGIDLQKYEGQEYPEDVNLVIGDALEVEFPRADTVILYDVLEHVDEPAALLTKAIGSCRQNVLVHVPKRNEEMWAHGVVEYHQLDKTHRHCGFSAEELHSLVDLSGGRIRTYKELTRTDATACVQLWNNRIPAAIVRWLSRIFSSRAFYQDIWCEVETRVPHVDQ